jgi:hypothetical protein
MLAAFSIVVAAAGCSGETAVQSASTAANPAQIPNPEAAPLVPPELWAPWQPNPIPLNVALLRAVDRECRLSMVPFPAAQLVVVDARGEGLLQAQFAAPNGAEAFCMDMTVDQQGRVHAMGGGSTGGGDAARLLGPLEMESRGGMATGGPGANDILRSVTSGRVGQGISSVAILVPGQGQMTAALANGWYVAWWPGPWPNGTKVVARDVLGNVVAEAAP